MKRILVLLLIALSVVGGWTALVNTENVQLSKMQQAASAAGQPFLIPNDPKVADPDQTYAALSRAASDAHVNIFRTSIGYTAANSPLVTQYVFLTSETHFFDSFGLTQGRLLSVPDTALAQDYLSTTDSHDPHQVGTLGELGGGDTISVRGLKAAYGSLPVAGTYYVEASSAETYQQFINSLVKNLNAESGAALTRADVETDGTVFKGIQSDFSGILTVISYLIVVLTTILLAYRQLYEAKRTAVMKLHGHGTLRMWFNVSGRLTLLTLGISGGLVLIAAAFIHDSTVSFVAGVFKTLLIFAAAMLAASLITCAYIVRIKLSESIKNRKDTKAVFILNTGLKAVCAVLLVVTGAGLWTQYSQASVERTKLGNWGSTRDYGIFFPTSVGNDLVEAETGQAGPTVAEVYDLYPLLDQAGAIYVDSLAYEPQALAQQSGPGTYRSMEVNGNYLKRFPVKDVNGRAVEVSEATTDWVLLVPVSYKNDAAAITSFFQGTRTGVGGQPGITAAEKALFNHVASPVVAKQHVRIIWVADQSVFSFNPLVNPTNGSVISSPIIQVMTASNSLGIDRANMITGGADTALKVKLQGADSTATLNGLLPELKTLKLDDNLRHLVTMNEYVVGQLAYLQQGIRSVIIAGISLGLAMLALIAQSLTVTFERFARKVVVRRLFGYSFIKSYKEFLLFFAAAWIVQLVGALLANAAGASPFSTATSSGASASVVVIVIGVIVLAVELMVSSVALVWIERRRTNEVLKGEF